MLEKKHGWVTHRDDTQGKRNWVFLHLCSRDWKHFYNETSTTSADPEFKKIKYDPGLLGCLIIIMLSLCLGREWCRIFISLFFVYLTLWISGMEKLSSALTVELVGDGRGTDGLDKVTNWNKTRVQSTNAGEIIQPFTSQSTLLFNNYTSSIYQVSKCISAFEEKWNQRVFNVLRVLCQCMGKGIRRS